VDSVVTHCLKDATAVKTFVPLMMGGMAFRLGRIGLMSAGEGILGNAVLRGISVAGGFGLEVGTYEMAHRALSALSGETNPNQWKWDGPGGWRQGLAAAAVSFGMLKFAGFVAKEQNLAFQHLFQSTALVAGHQAAAALDLLPRNGASLAQQLLEAEATNLQLAGGLGLAHHLLPGMHGLERGLDLSLHLNGGNSRPESGPSWTSDPTLAFAATGRPAPFRPNGTFIRGKEPSFPHFIELDKNFMVSSGEGGLDPETGDRLRGKFRLLFFDKTVGHHEFEIVELASRVPLPSALHNERLLEALLEAPNCGTQEQLFTATAIKYLLNLDALHTAQGTLDNALHQLLLTRSLEIPETVERINALHSLFEEMERGLTYPKILELLARHVPTDRLGSTDEMQFPLTFLMQHGARMLAEWKGYSLSSAIQIMNFIYSSHWEFNQTPHIIRWFGDARRRYDAGQLDATLDHAKRHPYGKVILERLLQIFLVQNAGEKLPDLLPRDDYTETQEWIQRLSGEGHSPKDISQRIEGTRHTAYFKHPALAQKVVDVTLDIESSLKDPSETDKRYEQLEKAIQTVFDTLEDEKRPFAKQDLVKLFELNQDHPPTQAILQRIKDQKYEVVFLPSDKFDQMVLDWGKVHQVDYTVFVQTHSTQKGDTIYIREVPRTVRTDKQREELTKEGIKLLDRRSPDEWVRALNEVLPRYMFFPHEDEHWWHSSGNYGGSEPEWKPFNFARIDREHRLISEVMASLEQTRHYTRNVEIDFPKIASRMGLNLPLFFSSLEEHFYYGKAYGEITRKLHEGKMPPPPPVRPK
jgi:hypothetical protein